MTRPALIVAIVLLILPVLYAGSYLALVRPEGSVLFVYPYQYGEAWSARIFWPLEQIDRKVRPGAWGFGGFRQEDFDSP